MTGLEQTQSGRAVCSVKSLKRETITLSCLKGELRVRLPHVFSCGLCAQRDRYHHSYFLRKPGAQDPTCKGSVTLKQSLYSQEGKQLSS